jgi:Protein of unknown function (DUF998)
MFDPRRFNDRRWVVNVGVASALLAAPTYSSFLLSPWTDPSSSGARTFISELELPGQPWGWLYRLSDIAAGVAIVLTAASLVLLRSRPRLGGVAALLVACGFGSILDGATTMHCAGPVTELCTERSPHALIAQLSVMHTDSGLVGLAAAACGAVVFGRRIAAGQPWCGHVCIGLGIAIAGTALLDLVFLLAEGPLGVSERMRTLLTSAWLLALAGWLARTHQDRRLHAQPI